MKKFQDSGDDLIDSEVVHLIDNFTSSSTNTNNDELNNLVREVQFHRHTKSCMKKGHGCRSNFPRLPSNKTIIARPDVYNHLPAEEKKIRIKRAREILMQVKEELEELQEKDFQKKKKYSIFK